MHDIMVETLFPEHRRESSEAKTLSPTVREAMKKAAARVNEFRTRRHSKSISTICKSRQRMSADHGEVRDIISLY